MEAIYSSSQQDYESGFCLMSTRRLYISQLKFQGLTDFRLLQYKVVLQELAG